MGELGYPVRAVKGPDGGYRLGDNSKAPPLLLDDEQAIAVAVALQTAPSSVSGIDDAVARALISIKQIMSARLRAEADSMNLTALRNYWEFAAPPIASETLTAVGSAVRQGRILSFYYLAPDGRRPHPRDADFVAPLRVEPHHVVIWAGRWSSSPTAPTPRPGPFTASTASTPCHRPAPRLSDANSQTPTWPATSRSPTTEETPRRIGRASAPS
nr:hypothetical protein [Aeromicrobium sp.]